jgi:hypothetical protein
VRVNAAHLVTCESRNFPTCGKHFHDRIISLIVEAWALKTSFTPQFFKCLFRARNVRWSYRSCMFLQFSDHILELSILFQWQSEVVAQVVPSHLHFCLIFKCCCICSWPEDACNICPCTLSNNQSINQTSNSCLSTTNELKYGKANAYSTYIIKT